jgi:hypothetical protein
MKHKNYGLIILGLLFSFNVNADALKEAQNFSIAVNDYQGFWFYSAGKAITPAQEEAFLKEWQRQSGKDLCFDITKQKPTYQKVKQQLKFVDNHAFLLFSDRENSPREQMVRHFASQYQLPLIVIHKKGGTFPLSGEGIETPVSLQNVFIRLNANFHDVFLLNPKKRQITLFSRSHTPCVLEQELFFAIYKNIPDYKDGQ